MGETPAVLSSMYIHVLKIISYHGKHIDIKLSSNINKIFFK